MARHPACDLKANQERGLSSPRHPLAAKPSLHPLLTSTQPFATTSISITPDHLKLQSCPSAPFRFLQQRPPILAPQSLRRIIILWPATQVTRHFRGMRLNKQSAAPEFRRRKNPVMPRQTIAGKAHAAVQQEGGEPLTSSPTIMPAGTKKEKQEASKDRLRLPNDATRAQIGQTPEVIRRRRDFDCRERRWFPAFRAFDLQRWKAEMHRQTRRQDRLDSRALA